MNRFSTSWRSPRRQNHIVHKSKDEILRPPRGETLHHLAIATYSVHKYYEHNHDKREPDRVKHPPKMKPSYCRQYKPSPRYGCTGTEWPVTTGQTFHTPNRTLPKKLPKFSKPKPTRVQTLLHLKHPERIKSWSGVLRQQ